MRMKRIVTKLAEDRPLKLKLPRELREKCHLIIFQTKLISFAFDEEVAVVAFSPQFSIPTFAFACNGEVKSCRDAKGII